MAPRIQIAKLQNQPKTDLPNLMLAKVTCYTVVCCLYLGLKMYFLVHMNSKVSLGHEVCIAWR